MNTNQVNSMIVTQTALALKRFKVTDIKNNLKNRGIEVSINEIKRIVEDMRRSGLVYLTINENYIVY